MWWGWMWVCVVYDWCVFDLVCLFYLWMNVSRFGLIMLVWVVYMLCGQFLQIFNVLCLSSLIVSFVELVIGMIWLLLLCIISIGMLIFFRFLVKLVFEKVLMQLQCVLIVFIMFWCYQLLMMFCIGGVLLWLKLQKGIGILWQNVVCLVVSCVWKLLNIFLGVLFGLVVFLIMIGGIVLIRMVLVMCLGLVWVM